LPHAQCVHAAVGLENGEVCFDGGGVGGAVGREGRLVRMVRLRDEVAADRSARLLVKMDIEGSEREVLPDLLPVLPGESTLFLETHFPADLSEQILKPLRDSGFTVGECRRRPDEGSDRLFIDWSLDRGDLSSCSTP